jgi:hypothetical protein
MPSGMSGSLPFSIAVLTLLLAASIASVAVRIGEALSSVMRAPIHLVRVVVASLLIAAMELPALRTTSSSSPGESFKRLRMMRT